MFSSGIVMQRAVIRGVGRRREDEGWRAEGWKKVEKARVGWKIGKRPRGGGGEYLVRSRTPSAGEPKLEGQASVKETTWRDLAVLEDQEDEELRSGTPVLCIGQDSSCLLKRPGIGIALDLGGSDGRPRLFALCGSEFFSRLEDPRRTASSQKGLVASPQSVKTRAMAWL
ncbi:hypothetical protein KM043_005895 [Ampulex compressa]|nr:hypothetical protein KM043_005895 [Ampulex compressa]